MKKNSTSVLTEWVSPIFESSSDVPNLDFSTDSPHADFFQQIDDTFDAIDEETGLFERSAERPSAESPVDSAIHDEPMFSGFEPEDQRSKTAKKRKSSPKKALSASSGTISSILEPREKVRRRRQIDPTTCERDYSLDEIEFMNALDDYKRSSGRMFPTCSEILEVIRSLGYVKTPNTAEPTEMAVERVATPLQSGTPALISGDSEENEEIVTIFWNQEKQTESEIVDIGPNDDFEYREPLLIF